MFALPWLYCQPAIRAFTWVGGSDLEWDYLGFASPPQASVFSSQNGADSPSLWLWLQVEWAHRPRRGAKAPELLLLYASVSAWPCLPAPRPHTVSTDSASRFCFRLQSGRRVQSTSLPQPQPSPLPDRRPGGRSHPRPPQQAVGRESLRGRDLAPRLRPVRCVRLDLRLPGALLEGGLERGSLSVPASQVPAALMRRRGLRSSQLS